MTLEDGYICKYVPLHSTGSWHKRPHIFSFIYIYIYIHKFSYAFTAITYLCICMSENYLDICICSVSVALNLGTIISQRVITFKITRIVYLDIQLNYLYTYIIILNSACQGSGYTSLIS